MIGIKTTIAGTKDGIRRIFGIVDELAASHGLLPDVVADMKTGFPAFIASITGSPNPSVSDGNATAAQRS